MERLPVVFATTLFMSCAWAQAPASPPSPPPAERTVVRSLGDDLFVAGGAPRVVAEVNGDLMAAGGSVETTGTVAGDAMVAGGEIRAGGRVGGSLLAAAGSLRIDAPIARNARVAGGRVELSPQASVAGNLTAAGGQLALRAPVGGYAQLGGGRVLIDSTIGGNVVVTAGTLELGPKADIRGSLRYASREELKRDPAARVAGAVERGVPEGGWPVPAKVEHEVGRSGGWLWTFGLVTLAALGVAAAPGFTRRTGDALRANPAAALLAGFAALFALPAAAVVLMVTLIGIPLGLALVFLFPVLLLVAWVLTATALGDGLLARFRARSADRRGWRAGAAAVVVLALGALAAVPFLGWLVVLATLCAGIGALVLRVLGSVRGRRSSVATAPV